MEPLIAIVLNVVLFAVGMYVLYRVIRVAVKHGTLDAVEAREKSGADAASHGGTTPVE